MDVVMIFKVAHSLVRTFQLVVESWDSSWQFIIKRMRSRSHVHHVRHGVHGAGARRPCFRSLDRHDTSGSHQKAKRSQ